MLLAVLEKKGGFRFGNKDVFLNIAGGIRVDDPATDLAVAAALVSSLQDIPLSRKSCFSAELGLSGEIRSVARVEQRIAEAERIGFETIYISGYNYNYKGAGKTSIKVVELKKLDELLENLFG
jgi:DNA repair protein RadA/Sms